MMMGEAENRPVLVYTFGLHISPTGLFYNVKTQ